MDSPCRASLVPLVLTYFDRRCLGCLQNVPNRLHEVLGVAHKQL